MKRTALLKAVFKVHKETKKVVHIKVVLARVRHYHKNKLLINSWRFSHKIGVFILGGLLKLVEQP